MKEKATYDFSLEKNNGKREEIFRRSVSQRLVLTWGTWFTLPTKITHTATLVRTQLE
jgi:hypothetical protein